MGLAIVLVNWRNEDQTVRCARALTKWEKLHPSILIIDNESTKESRTTLSGCVNTAQLICSPTNLGYSGGNNLGIMQALTAGCEYIMLLNSDAKLPEECARRLLKRLEENPGISILGPMIQEKAHDHDQVLVGGRDIAHHAFTRVKARRNAIRQITDYPLHRVEYVPGTVFLARANVFRDIGLLDEDFFFSGEIADVCKRAKDRGYALCVDLEAEAHHQPESAARAGREAIYTYYSLRNRFLYVKKHHASRRHLYFGYWTMIAALMLARAVPQRNFEKARAILLAVTHAYGNRFGNQKVSFA